MKLKRCYVNPREYDALLLPGGRAPEYMNHHHPEGPLALAHRPYPKEAPGVIRTRDLLITSQSLWTS